MYMYMDMYTSIGDVDIPMVLFFTVLIHVLHVLIASNLLSKYTSAATAPFTCTCTSLQSVLFSWTNAFAPAVRLIAFSLYCYCIMSLYNVIV